MALSPERQLIVDTAESLIGTPSMHYVYGKPELGTTPEDGFDCSGFVRYVLDKSGLHIPPHFGYDGSVRQTRHTNELWDTYGISVEQEYALPGDLIFFSREGWWPTHIGIYTGADEYIHAPGKDDTEVRKDTFDPQGSPIPEPVSEHRRLHPHRRLYSTNPIGFKSPAKYYGPDYRISQTPID